MVTKELKVLAQCVNPIRVRRSAAVLARIEIMSSPLVTFNFKTPLKHR